MADEDHLVSNPFDVDCSCLEIQDLTNVVVSNICTLYLNKSFSEGERGFSNPLYSKYCHSILQKFIIVHSDTFYDNLLVYRRNGGFRNITHMDQIVDLIFGQYYLKDQSDAHFYQCFAQVIICCAFLENDGFIIGGNVRNSLFSSVKFGIFRRMFHRNYDKVREFSRSLINYVFKWWGSDLKLYLPELEIKLGMPDVNLPDSIKNFLPEHGHELLARWSWHSEFWKMDEEKFFRLEREIWFDYPTLNYDHLEKKLEYLLKHSLLILHSVNTKYIGSVELGIDMANRLLASKTSPP